MPLSEEELRLLEQMERALVAEDPKLASTLRGTSRPAADRTRALISAAAFVVGVVVLLVGAMMSSGDSRVTGMLVGVGGFVIMLVAATMGLAALRRPAPDAARSGDGTAARPSAHAGFGVVDGGRSSRRPRRPKSSGGFMERLEERWRRRRESGEF